MYPFLFVWLFKFWTYSDFREDQLQNDRVREAYIEKGLQVQTVLRRNAIKPGNLNVYLVAYKQEQELEVWGKNTSDSTYEFLQKYAICRLSGTLGPKRKEGDLQIPEGFYAIDGFNPNSQYYLSLRINYPNTSDKVLGYRPKPGSLIFLHGDCVTVGCLPLTDDKIKELYIYCVEAKTSNQEIIPITIYPARLTTATFAALNQKYSRETDKLNLWADLKSAYQFFENRRQLPSITFLPDGPHLIK